MKLDWETLSTPLDDIPQDPTIRLGSIVKSNDFVGVVRGLNPKINHISYFGLPGRDHVHPHLAPLFRLKSARLASKEDVEAFQRSCLLNPHCSYALSGWLLNQTGRLRLVRETFEALMEPFWPMGIWPIYQHYSFTNTFFLPEELEGLESLDQRRAEVIFHLPDGLQLRSVMHVDDTFSLTGSAISSPKSHISKEHYRRTFRGLQRLDARSAAML